MGGCYSGASSTAAMCCSPSFDSCPLDHVLQEALSGDVILFSQSNLASSWKCLTRSEWNHVAIVVETPSGIKYLVEAVAPSVIAWRLTEAIDYWMSSVASTERVVWRRLEGVHRNNQLTQAMFDFSMKMQGRSYENNLMEMVRAVLKQDREFCCGSKENKQQPKTGASPHPALRVKPSSGLCSCSGEKAKDDEIDIDDVPNDPRMSDKHREQSVKAMLHGTSPSGQVSPQSPAGPVVHDMSADLTDERLASTETVFCSELVALYYQQAGWMTKDVLPCRFLPKDFADYRSANVQRYLQKGISLGPMIEIVPNADLIGTNSDAAIAEACSDGCRLKREGQLNTVWPQHDSVKAGVLNTKEDSADGELGLAPSVSDSNGRGCLTACCE